MEPGWCSIAPNIYIANLMNNIKMAATPPNAKKRRVEYNLDQNTYDDFVKACSRKGFAPQAMSRQYGEPLSFDCATSR